MIVYTKHQELIIKNYKCQNKVYSSNKRFEDNLTLHDIVVMLEKYKLRCFYCNDSLNAKTWQLDHFYSRYLGGKNVPENIVPSCKWCNLSKNSLDGFSYVDKCRKVVENNFLNRNNIEIYKK